MAEIGGPPSPHTGDNAPARPERQAFASEPYLREASDIRIRERISWAMIAYCGFLLVCVMALFFLQGFGAVSLSDAAMAALSGILVGNTAVGALFLQVIKGVFPS
jgi:hypothetical protein